MKSSRVLVFLVHIATFAEDWGLVKRFTFGSLIVILLGMAGIGWWVGEKIKTGVIKESVATTALYMDSFVAPNLQELGQSDSITPEHIEVLNNLFSKSDLGSRVVSVKIWDKNHRIIYSNIPALVGRTFPDTADQLESWNGEITGDISNLQEEENVEERRLSSDPLFQVYSPVRLNDTNQIIAIAEFYQKVDTLEAEIAAAQRWGWFMVGTTLAFIYLLLVGFVRWANNTLELQGGALENQVRGLTRLLSQNNELNQRVHRAAANTTALNERFLRRTGAELHDGPVQEISLALLRLDRAIEINETCRFSNPNGKCNESLPIVRTALQVALQEMRAIAASLSLPHLNRLTLSEVIIHAVRSHENRTGTKVILSMNDVTAQADLPVKITAYRFIQEGLNNAYHHAGGVGQEVRVACKWNQMQIEVMDQGPGFDVSLRVEVEEQLGLAGMRERVESLGGLFKLESKINEGTKLIARLALQNIGDNTNG